MLGYLPKEIQDAWCYSSVKDKRQYNVCFRADAALELLSIDAFLI